MNKIGIMAAGVSAAALGASVYAATPAAPPPPIASYWMDVATASGLGAGMTPGGRPSMASVLMKVCIAHPQQELRFERVRNACSTVGKC